MNLPPTFSEALDALFEKRQSTIAGAPPHRSSSVTDHLLNRSGDRLDEVDDARAPTRRGVRGDDHDVTVENDAHSLRGVLKFALTVLVDRNEPPDPLESLQFDLIRRRLFPAAP